MWLPAFLLDPWLRRQAKLHLTPLDTYRVRAAHSLEEYEDAFKLLHVAYVFQGIEQIRGVDMRITPQHVLPESTVLVAYEGDMVVGTMTVTLDSPAGLPLDHDYPEALATFRRSGSRLAEFGSLAVVRRCWHTGVTNLLNYAAFRLITMLDVTDVILGINPRAALFYRAVYGFVPLGEPRHHAELQAPVVGMIINTAAALGHVSRHFRQPLPTGHLPHEHFTRLTLDCIELPPEIPAHDLMRWKLPREVFQEIFINKSNRIGSLDPVTQQYLAECRSRQTMAVDGVADEPSVPATGRP